MLKLVSRKLFFSVPSLKGLSDSERAEKLKEISAAYSNSFTKPHQEKMRSLLKSLPQEQSEKLDLILNQLLKLNTFEVMSLRRSVQESEDSEYNWPIFPRPNMNSNRIPSGTAVEGLGIISSSLDLIDKLYSGKAENEGEKNNQKKEEVKPVVVEKTTFNIVLTGFDPSAKVKFIKCIKDVLGLGLKESKDKVEESAKGPVVLFKSVSKESHGKILEQLQAAGGLVEFN